MNQRKNELKSNELAGWLEQQLANSSRWLKPLLAVAAVLALVVLVVFGIRSQRDRSAGVRWAAFLQAGRDDAALRDVAKKHPGTNTELWARVSRAAIELQGQQLQGFGGAAIQLHLNRQAAEEAVESAIEDLEKVIEETQNQRGSLVRTNALFDLGQAYELHFEVDKAKERYDQLVSESPQSALAAVAKKRAETLSQSEMRQFYVWFAKQEAPKPGGSTPPGSVPDVSDAPDLPFELNTLPDFPDLSVPSPAPPPETPTPEAPETPEASPKKQPAEKAPAEKAPAEKAPAEKAPAEKAPAEKAPADE